MSCRPLHLADWFQFGLDRDRLSLIYEGRKRQEFTARLGAAADSPRAGEVLLATANPL
jgi:hypothetical protein